MKDCDITHPYNALHMVKYHANTKPSLNLLSHVWVHSDKTKVDIGLSMNYVWPPSNN
jgi:hypothetical protein